MIFSRSRMILLVFLLLPLLFGAGCKIPLDERQAVAELKKQTATLIQEAETGSGRQLKLERDFAALKLQFDEVRDQLLRQAEEIKALKREQVVLLHKLENIKSLKSCGVEKKKVVPEAVFTPEKRQAFEASYEESLAAYRNGDYASSVKLFAAFLRDFPHTEKSANARYWLGESYYSLAQYAQAVSEFKRVRKDFPASSKDSDALLKIAMSYEAIGSDSQARAAYKELLQRYPAGDSADRAQKALIRIE